MIKFGSVVYSKTGRFLHIARNESETICGKEIHSLYSRQDSPVDCRICNGRGKR